MQALRVLRITQEPQTLTGVVGEAEGVLEPTLRRLLPHCGDLRV